MEVDESIAPDAKRLLGNVVFNHEGAIMYCDSAYYYSDSNSLDAYNKVYINQGDTMHLYCDILYYKGNTKMALARKNVKMVNKESTLYTDFLDFDRNTNIAYYNKKGKIVSGDNVLYSKKGYYHSNNKIFYFKDSVKIVTPDYTIYSDTMQYNTVSELAIFLGPTNIIGKENTIYCERGWFNTQKNYGSLKKNARVNGDGTTLRGDSIFYNKEFKYGEGFRNVLIEDSTENILLTGDYGYYYEDCEEALMTKKAMMIQVSEEDTLFLHADTLFSELDTLSLPKTGIDSTGNHKLVKAFHHVKFFRSTIQGKCDSLTYTAADSIFRMYHKPVLWSDSSQLSAVFIEMYTGKQRIDSLKMYETCMIISEQDSTNYNQVKGKEMTGFFKENELYQINVYGSSQSVYFPKEENDVIGVNKAQSTNMIIYLKDKEIEKIKFLVKPEATFYPLDQAPAEELILKDFKWLEYLRPLKKEDIFIWKDEKIEILNNKKKDKEE